MEKDIRDLVEISRYYGKNKRAVIAGGGNTSLKTMDRMWIKASGFPLATIEEGEFAIIDREKLRFISTAVYSENPFEREREIKDDLAAANLTPGCRPSVETSLHDLISYKFVVHLHPTLVNGILCSAEAGKHIDAIFGRDSLYIPYTDPGYTLYKEIELQLATYRKSSQKDPSIILIQNHGIFVGADNADKIREIYDGIFDRLNKNASEPPSGEPGEIPTDLINIIPALRMMVSNGPLKTLRLRNNGLIEYFTASEENFELISKPFTPDIITYCKSYYLYFENRGPAGDLRKDLDIRIDAFEKQFGYIPKVLLIRGLGMIAVGDNAADADNILDIYEDKMLIAWHSGSFGGPHPLTPEQIRFIDTWEVESYRRMTATGAGGSGSADQRIVIISNAVNGFGPGIARGLFSKGANVVLADANEEAGKIMIQELDKMGMKNQAIFFKTDFLDPESLEELMRETVTSFGGIDCFISNAEILISEGLNALDEASSDRITKINDNAYIYGVKAVSKIMKIQQEAQAAHSRFCDIIQINSISGLTQSLARDFALYKIKVNSICPGAKTLDEVRKHYESQEPIGHTSLVKNVLKAVLYILEQEYETGQVIPVTDG
jgi:rhamnose utilization protein RhaD (predicted bifunctional aldolase and dehydrogenase)/NAD(P)-dependent dehydrogenase (short-subunit alcohol dehydrogenase family)